LLNSVYWCTAASMSDLLLSTTTFILNVISGLGYPGVVLLMAVQTMAVPIPSEIVLPFAGSLIVTGQFTLVNLALAGGLGSTIGGLIAYQVGRTGGRPLVERYGKRVLISKYDLNLAEKFLAKYGTAAVLIGTMLPVIRSVISFPAGILKMPLKKFLLMVFIGSFFWSLLLGYIGMKLGENWGTVREQLHRFDTIIIILVILLITFWIRRHIKHR
jgi:membrane protein DedA with SNARE-associated domain